MALDTPGLPEEIPQWELEVTRAVYEEEQRKAKKGWSGGQFVPLDGTTWTLEIASGLLGIPLPLLRLLVRETGVEPAGLLRMRAHAGSGRQPRGYRASDLIVLAEGLHAIRREINDAHSADKV